MRIILRVGGILGGAGFVLLYALQAEVALVVAAGVVLAGLLAGLGAAKWLPRAWYGRQFKAGLRTGMLAAGLAGLGALLSLFMLGPRDVPTLAARSHLAGFSLAPVVNALAFLTWAGADIIVILLAAALSCGLAAIVAQIAGWSKNAEAIRVVQQARLAAQSLNRDEAWQAHPTGAPHSGQPIHAFHQFGVPALASPSLSNVSGIPGPVSGAGVTGAPLPTGFASATGMTPGLGLAAPLSFTPGSGIPAQPAPPSRPPRAPMPSPSADPEFANATEPVLPIVPTPSANQVSSAPGEPGKPSGRRRSASSRRRADQELTLAMRDALAAWASEDAGAETSKTDDKGPSRAPASSAYLNSAGPAPKRSRKKQHTRDWLC